MADRQGQKFWYRWRDDYVPVLDVVYRGRWVARVNMNWNNTECELVDIVIHKPEFRRRGLGAAIMHEIIAHARSKGMRAIVGTIKPGAGGEPREYLREWYARQGFQVRANLLFMDLTAGGL